jgi:hypothetical protein
MTLRILVLLGLVGSLAMGCVYRGHHDDPYPPGGPSGPGVRHGHGPPPHAPAHGHRAKFQAHDLEYDEARGIYIVIGLPGLFWYDGWYHRRSGDRWQRSGSFDGPWHDSRWDDIPPGLRGSAPGKGKGKGRDKGKGPH